MGCAQATNHKKRKIDDDEPYLDTEEKITTQHSGTPKLHLFQQKYWHVKFKSRFK
jgi:hypothetical protein